jgi:probable HAF family extracellular repeat protein
MNVAQRIFVVGMLALSSTLVPLAMASAHTAGAASTQAYNMVDIGSLGGSNEFCNTCFQTVHGGLNNKGQIAGISATKDGSFHAFLYSGGKMTDLGPWYPASML